MAAETIRQPARRLSQAEMIKRLPAWRNDAALWASEVVWIAKPDGSIGPIELYPEQAEGLRQASRREPHPEGLGKPIHKTTVFSRPKRNNKSQDAAILVAHAQALFVRRTSAIVANSQDQARSVTFDYVADIFDYSPNLQGMAYYGTKRLDGSLGKRPEVTTISLPDVSGEVRAVVPNIRTIQGRGINGIAVIEELQAAYSEESYALLASQAEASSAQIVIASQAGHRNGALYRLYKEAYNQGGDNPRIWFDYWGDEDEFVANLAPWVSPEFLADALINMTPWEFAKYHRNLWGSGTQNFLTPDLIDMLFGIDYPLAVQRHQPQDRKLPATALQVMSAEDWRDLCEEMQWHSWTVGIGLDRAMPYAEREGTCVSATLKCMPSAEQVEAGYTPGPHFWQIASIDCPDGSEAEIDEACESIETAIGRRVWAREYETYQSADIAEKHHAELISPTTGRQVVLFNRTHQLTREGRHHASPQSIGLRFEFEEFTVDNSHALPRFEHPSGGTDDRIYADGYSLDAVVDAPIMAHRSVKKAGWM